MNARVATHVIPPEQRARPQCETCDGACQYLDPGLGHSVDCPDCDGSGEPGEPDKEYDCEDILLAFETFLRKGDHQIQYRAGRFRVRLVDREHDAVSYSADLTVALEGALRNVGAL